MPIRSRAGRRFKIHIDPPITHGSVFSETRIRLEIDELRSRLDQIARQANWPESIWPEAWKPIQVMIRSGARQHELLRALELTQYLYETFHTSFLSSHIVEFAQLPKVDD
jgi:hypothetical protein